jgi:hypothetical protein
MSDRIADSTLGKVVTPQLSSGPLGGNEETTNMTPTILRRSTLSILIILLLGPVIFGTEPLPPPYHQFRASGQLARTTGASKENFIVTLVGKFSYPARDTTIVLTSGFAYYPSKTPVSMTDTSGIFYLDLKSQFKPDSVAVQVSAVDKPITFGTFLAVPEPSITFTEEYQEQRTGCSSCATSEPMHTYVTGYQYQLPTLFVTIPY